MSGMEFVAGDLIFAPLADEDVAAFISESREDFVEGLVAAGEERAAVEEQADAIHARLLPDGRLNPDHRIGHLVSAGEPVGHLWVARDDQSAWYVWDVAIKPEHQSRGFGRAAMNLAEKMARADGADSIGLSVLVTNDIARTLYGSLGYEVVEPQSGPLVRMSKKLGTLAS
ncbi:MAG TPA: GNAT family N-acetyltransferase [Mycobacteriales bacterium]|nr:GNAT family N-acetyltransferase [Mycobacteriales bacterium]